MRYLLSLSILLCIHIVAYGDTYTSTIQSWVGKSESHLTARWGEPDVKVVKRNGNTLYIYVVDSYKNYYQSQQFQPAVGVNVSGGRPTIVTNPTPGQPPAQNYLLNCTVTFEVDHSNKVVHTGLQGNGCHDGTWPISP